MRYKDRQGVEALIIDLKRRLGHMCDRLFYLPSYAIHLLTSPRFPKRPRYIYLTNPRYTRPSRHLTTIKCLKDNILVKTRNGSLLGTKELGRHNHPGCSKSQCWSTPPPVSDSTSCNERYITERKLMKSIRNLCHERNYNLTPCGSLGIPSLPGSVLIGSGSPPEGWCPKWHNLGSLI